MRAGPAKYADLVNTNKWRKNSWSEHLSDVPVGQQSRVRNIARKFGLLNDIIPVDPKTWYADFSAVAMRFDQADANGFVELPKSQWHLGRDEHEKFLDKRYFPNGRPEGYTWHHHQVDGKMQLVPTGIHTATYHRGGLVKGHWADGVIRP